MRKIRRGRHKRVKMPNRARRIALSIVFLTVALVPLDIYANGQAREHRKILLDQISHSFAHYKDLEPDKWVKVVRWGEAEEAFRFVEEAIKSK